MLLSYIKLGIAALIPVFATYLIYLVDTKTPFKDKPYIVKQLIIGMVFGGIAIIGTEWGIPIYGTDGEVVALANCRDAAPVTAALLFGGPAGIIAGVIGGIERYIAVAWGAGTFTQIGCSIATIFAGLFAAYLRKYIFENKRPAWTMALATGLVVEVVHLTLIFITNGDEMAKTYSVISSCCVPMIVANSLSVYLSAIVNSAIARDDLAYEKEKARLADTIQSFMLICVAIAYLGTTIFGYIVQTETAKSNITDQMKYGLEDVTAAILEASDNNLQQITKKIAHNVDNENLEDLLEFYGVSEINVADENGIITRTTNPNYLGFDFNSGEQSQEFLELIGQKDRYIVQEYGPISYDKNIYMKYAAYGTENGLVQVGYDAAKFHSEINDEVKTAAHNRRISSSGYFVVTDYDNNIISTRDDIEAKNISEYGVDEADYMVEEYTYYEFETATGKVCTMYASVEGYYVLSVVPYDEAYYVRNLSTYFNSFMEVIVFALLFIMIYNIVKRAVVHKLDKINEGLEEITKGNLDEVIDVNTNTEFIKLSKSINTTVDALKGYIAEAEARIDAELEFAKSIQASAVPSVFPAFPNRKDIDVYAGMYTAKEVGGDFYDFYFTEKNIFNFLIADVSGKGIPAALFMMRAKTELKSLTETGMSLDEVFTKGNNALCEGNDADMFVTAWQASVDLDTGHVLYANAGHNHPLVKHADGKFEFVIGKPGFVLAGMEGVPYKIQEFDIAPGDTIFVYTDGVNEATDAHNELYGDDRLVQILNSREFADMKELCEAVKADVDKFVGEAPQFDDITMVAFKYIGK